MITATEFQEAIENTALHLHDCPMEALEILQAHDRENMKGMFKKRFTLVGRDWIKRLPPEVLKDFIQIGLDAAKNGHLGGLARAAGAKRNAKGEFMKGGE